MAEAFDAFERGKTGIMSPFTAAAVSNQTIQESMRLILLVRSYQVGCSSCSHHLGLVSQHAACWATTLSCDSCRCWGTTQPTWIPWGWTSHQLPLSSTRPSTASQTQTWTASEFSHARRGA